MEMGNVSKRQQPRYRSDNSRRSPIGLQCSEKLPHMEASFSWPLNKYLQWYSDNGHQTKLMHISQTNYMFNRKKYRYWPSIVFSNSLLIYLFFIALYVSIYKHNIHIEKMKKNYWRQSYAIETSTCRNKQKYKQLRDMNGTV